MGIIVLKLTVTGGKGRTPLMVAVVAGSEAGVKALVSQPATDLHTRDNMGNTLDHFAGGNRNIVSLLRTARLHQQKAEACSRQGCGRRSRKVLINIANYTN